MPAELHSADGSPQPGQVASWTHLAGFLLIMAGVMAFGFYAQHGVSSSAVTQSSQLASHGSALRIYLVAGLMDWALLYYCWVGVHHRGGTLATLSGGRWASWRQLAIDLAIAVPFFLVWEGVALGVSRLLGPGSAKTVDSLLPQTLPEILLWIAVSITAGICEEMAFRGYLQQQLSALGGNIPLAVLGQAVVFGVAHSYQGWKQVVVITVLGVLYGILAAGRHNLRVNIVAHAFTDVWEGWLKFVFWRAIGH